MRATLAPSLIANIPIGHEYAVVEEQVLRFIENAPDTGDARAPVKRGDCIRPGSDEAAFNTAARAVFLFQRRYNTPYARYCESLGVPVEIAGWREIPAVPQQAFKQFDLRAFPEERTARTFLTSGTTGESRGRHHFCSMRLYEAAILNGWRHAGLPVDKRPRLILTPDPMDAPQSSLSYMMGTLGQGQSPRFLISPGGQLDVDAFLDMADRYRRAQQAVLALGTALAFLRLFEALARHGLRCPLPAGSVAMETGGYKGSGRELAKPDLYARFNEYLGLAPDAVVNEYGMTELSSQFYTRGLNRPHEGPPWARALVIDPETGSEVAVGQTGVLRLFDLANLGSVMAVQTQDLAIRRRNGAFDLLGRDPAALPRGCSRAADEILA